MSLKRTLFYYVHHHGKGHAKLFERLRPELQKHFDVHALTHSIDLIDLFDPSVTSHILPAKLDEGMHFKHTFTRAFEGVPYSKSAVNRINVIANLVVNHSPAVFVSDGSAEIAISVRSMGVPVVYNQLLGDTRSDPTQIFAGECADIITAFYPRHMEHDWRAQNDKTIHFGFVSEYGNVHTSSDNTITILLGSDDNLAKKVPDIVLSCNEIVQIVGDSKGIPDHPRIIKTGYLENLSDKILGSIVITSAGLNSLSDLIAMNKKIIAIASERPYEEQLHNVINAERAGYVVSHSPGEDWNSTIRKAQALRLNRNTGSMSMITKRYAEIMNERYGL